VPCRLTWLECRIVAYWDGSEFRQLRNSGRFVKQEQWERWGLGSQMEIGVSESNSKHRGRERLSTGGYVYGRRTVAPSRCGSPGISPAEKILRFYMQNSAIWCIFGRKISISIARLPPSFGRSRQIYTMPQVSTPPLKNEGVSLERDWASDAKMTEQNVSWSFYISVAFLYVLKHNSLFPIMFYACILLTV